jgi:hypothetical protein
LRDPKGLALDFARSKFGMLFASSHNYFNPSLILTSRDSLKTRPTHCSCHINCEQASCSELVRGLELFVAALQVTLRNNHVTQHPSKSTDFELADTAARNTRLASISTSPIRAFHHRSPPAISDIFTTEKYSHDAAFASDSVADANAALGTQLDLYILNIQII